MQIIIGCFIGFCAWFVVRYLIAGLYTVDQNERAVKTRFGRADRIENLTILDDPIAEHLRPEVRERYRYPQVRVIPSGGPYWKWPWEKVHKVSIATQTLNMAYDPENPSANQRRHDSGGGDQGPVEYRIDRTDSLPRVRPQSLRLRIRGEPSDRARDGLLHFGVAGANCQL